MSRPSFIFTTSAFFLCCGLLVACGATPPPEPPKTSYSAGELDFIAAGKRHNIPSRLLLAIAHVESGVHPEKSSATYQSQSVGPETAQTAFGVSLTKLGLSAGAAEHSLKIQTEAYAKWLTQQIPPGLSARFDTAEEKFNWIWNAAEAHRTDNATRSLFAKELITALNQGFYWNDPKKKSVVPVAPENPPIELESLRPVSQNQLKIFTLTRRSPVRSARQIILSGQREHPKLQQARGISVIHCPFSFSSCVEMQKTTFADQSGFSFGAHFVIPENPDQSEYPLQIAKLNHVVPNITPEGTPGTSDNKVVIMLTGASGRIVKSSRAPADPSWLNPWQLQRMGELVHDICSQLSLELEDSESPLTIEECKNPSKEGTQFLANPMDADVHWGEIPDFDQAIFGSYILHPERLAGKTLFEYPYGKQIFKMGEKISLKLSFGLRVRSVQLQRLMRCESHGGLAWSTIANEQVRSRYSFVFEKKLFDAGPNGNGTHFFRAKTYGEDGELLGWDQASIYLTSYESKIHSFAPDVCRP